VKEGKKRLL